MSHIYKYKCSCGSEDFNYEVSLGTRIFKIKGEEVEGVIDFKGPYDDHDVVDSSAGIVKCAQCDKLVPENVINDVLIE